MRRDCFHAGSDDHSLADSMSTLVVASRTDPVLRQLVENVEHDTMRLVSIVSDLADADIERVPLNCRQHGRSARKRCLDCGVICPVCRGDWEAHEPDCMWRRAVEWKQAQA